MGTGKKKIEIEKIEDKTTRMYTFSTRKKGLFKKIEELESLTCYPMAYVVFSSTKTPYSYGDVNSAIIWHFPRTICTKRSTSGMNSHYSSCDVDVVVSGGSLGLKSSSTPQKNSLHGWVEGIDVEECQNLNHLLMLKDQLEGTRKKIVSTDVLNRLRLSFCSMVEYNRWTKVGA